MAQAGYTAEELLQLGRTNYEKLVMYCSNLENEGFWEQARQVMKQSSTEVLDRYVQSVLMTLAIHCGNLLENQKEYIALITDTNPLGIVAGEEVDQQTVEDCLRFTTFPPILMQLCGVYDQRFDRDSGEYFLDAFLNILLCMAYLNDGKDAEVNQFIREYYEKICLFLNQAETYNHKEFLFRKLRGKEVTCDVKWLHVSRETDKSDKARQKQEVADTSGEPQMESSVSAGPVELQEPPRDTDKQQEVAEEQSEAELKKARLAKERLEAEAAREQFQLVKKRLQDREEAERQAREARLQKLVDELNALVGLQGVKNEIQSLINLIKIRKLREKMKMPTMDMSYHMVFTGAPGTGKTTVARIVAKIYQELGILTKDTVIETDRSGLVAGYVGQTALKVHELVEQAIGGVLFIDEAYALVNPDVPNDFGMEAVDTLVKLMEDHRDNLVIIVAGYTQEMKAFLKCNTGLVSRFNKFIDFPDYTDQELLDILDVMAAKAGLTIESEGREAIAKQLQQMDADQKAEFGNARGIRNLFEKIVINQANRLIQQPQPTKEMLMTIVKEDVIAVCTQKSNMIQYKGL